MLLLLILLQGVRYLIFQIPAPFSDLSHEHATEVQQWLDSIKTAIPSGKNSNTYIYNPNTLSDYQGYMLGLTPIEIDRLIRFRVQGNSIGGPVEFKQISGISDSLMYLIAPRLRFPSVEPIKDSQLPASPDLRSLPLKDLNRVTASELRRIKGIGPVLSERIIKFRNRLQGFQLNEQLYDVYGLDRSVANRLLQYYTVLSRPDLNPVNVNRATTQELAQLVYLNWKIARQITRYRERFGPFTSLEELTKIEDFPSDKIDRIKLYLSL